MVVSIEFTHQMLGIYLKIKQNMKVSYGFLWKACDWELQSYGWNPWTVPKISKTDRLRLGRIRPWLDRKRGSLTNILFRNLSQFTTYFYHDEMCSSSTQSAWDLELAAPIGPDAVITVIYWPPWSSLDYLPPDEMCASSTRGAWGLERAAPVRPAAVLSPSCSLSGRLSQLLRSSIFFSFEAICVYFFQNYFLHFIIYFKNTFSELIKINQHMFTNHSKQIIMGLNSSFSLLAGIFIIWIFLPKKIEKMN